MILNISNDTLLKGTKGISILITKVIISKKASKEIIKIPYFLIDKLEIWIQTIEEIGLEETKKVSGYHDEPLLGKRKGQRSIRLNRSYRAIYKINLKVINFVEIIEVNKHDY